VKIFINYDIIRLCINGKKLNILPRGGILQKVLIIYSTEGDLKNMAESIAQGARQNGYEVELVDTNYSGRPISFFKYDLVVAGAPTQGIFRGKIPSNLSKFLKDCKRTTGQEAMAFVTPRFFATNKALKKVMGELEKLGCIVKDFRALKNEKKAKEFGNSFNL
jgi:menaquinone-dependent protoporphyrinogen IX oxidase